MRFRTSNPATGEALQEYRYQTESEVENVLSSSHLEWQNLKLSTLDQRVDCVLKLATNLKFEKENLSRLMALEMGKPIRDGRLEVEKCITSCEILANHAKALLGPQQLRAQHQQTEILKQSLGPILIVMPWNYPLWQVIRTAVPNFLLGNSVVLKHSDIVAGTSALLTKIFSNSLMTPFDFQELKIDHPAAAKVIQDFRIRGVSFTGSARGGTEIAKLAGASLKKTVMELGGSDAYITCHDADIDLAAKTSATARMINNGQSCIAAKRFYVHESIFEAWLERFKSELSIFKSGNPLDENCLRGPLAHLKFRTCLEEQTSELLQNGGKLLWQTDEPKLAPSYPHAYLSIQIIESKLGNNWIYENELFGPVAVVIRFQDEKQMIIDVNRSKFGLGAAVFSTDIDRARSIATAIDAGMITINGQVRSDARTPFGGVKNSGYGREMGGIGDLEFCNIKTLGID